MEENSGLFMFLCSECRTRSPMLVQGQYRWRCVHHHATVFEDAGHRSLVFDEDTVRSLKRPRTIDNMQGPFFTRVVT